MWVLNEGYVKSLVALLTELTVCAIYCHSLVWGDLLTQLSLGAIY